MNRKLDDDLILSGWLKCFFYWIMMLFGDTEQVVHVTAAFSILWRKKKPVKARQCRKQ